MPGFVIAYLNSIGRYVRLDDDNAVTRPIEALANHCAENTIPCARDLRYPGTRAVVVVEAQPSDFVTETITMIIIAIVASLGAIAVLCWLLFTLAVFALPFFAGVTLGLWAHGTGAGILGGVIVGAFAAAVTFGLFQLLLLFVRPAWLKLLVLLVFVAPAVIAGYHATFGIVKLTMPSETWQVIFAMAGAIAVGITAFMRLTMMAPPGSAEQGIARAS